MLIPSLLAAELERKAPGRWSLAPGRRHWRLMIDGRQVTILSRTSTSDRQGERRAVLNQRAAVRRYLAYLR